MMTNAASPSVEPTTPPAQWLVPIGLASAVGLITMVLMPGLAKLAAIPIAAAVGASFLFWPDLTTLCVIGLVYTNLPVVAVLFHGAPRILPAAVLALLGWPFVSRIVFRRESIRLEAALPFAFGLFLIHLVGGLISREREAVLAHLVSFLTEGFALYFILTNVVRTRRMLQASLWTLALGGVLMGGVPLAQQLAGRQDSTFGGLAQTDSAFTSQAADRESEVVQARFAGTIGEQNRFAQFMLLLVPVGLSLANLETSPVRQMAAYVSSLFALLGAALAFSRGAAVGCALSLAAAIWLKLLTPKQIRFVVLAGCLTLVAFPQYVTRLASLASIAGLATGDTKGIGKTDGAVRGRLTEMGAAILAFRDHPLVGVGTGAFVTYSQQYGQIIGLRSLEGRREAHSLPLEIAAESGILGFVVFFGMVWVVGRRVYAANRGAVARNDVPGMQLSSALLFMGILYMTTSLFLHMSYIRYFWMLVALADSTATIVARGDCGADLLPPRWVTPPTGEDSSKRCGVA